MALPSDPSKPTPASQRDAAQQDGFLREVDEALREQQFVDMVRNYGRPVGMAILAGLLGLAGYLWWDHSTKQAAGERSEKMIMALDTMGSNGLASASVLRDLEPLTKDGAPGSTAAALMLRASILQQQGKTDDAVKTFAGVAADTKAPQVFRDLATIRQTAIEFDKLQPQQVVDRLKPLAIPGNAWFGSAAELSGLAWLKAGKPDMAAPLFANAAKDKDVPESLRARLRLMAGELGADTGDVPTPTPSPGSANAAAPAAQK